MWPYFYHVNFIVLFGFFVVIAINERKKTIKHHIFLEKLVREFSSKIVDTSREAALDLSNIDIDIVLTNDDSSLFSSDSSSYGEVITRIASSIDKGYNFLTVKHVTPGSGSNLHYHAESDELIYIISGTVNVIVLNKEIKTSRFLKEKEWVFLPKKTSHSVLLVSDTAEYIIVAKPAIINEYKEGRVVKFLKRLLRCKAAA